jgi:hypothetical protein
MIPLKLIVVLTIVLEPFLISGVAQEALAMILLRLIVVLIMMELHIVLVQ